MISAIKESDQVHFLHRGWGVRGGWGRTSDAAGLVGRCAIDQPGLHQPPPPSVSRCFLNTKKGNQTIEEECCPVKTQKKKKHLILVQSYCVIHCAENFPLLLTFYINSKKK